MKIHSLAIVALLSMLAGLPPQSAEAQDVTPKLRVLEEEQAYRRIMVEVEISPTADTAAYQLWFSKAPFRRVTDAQLHSIVLVGDTAGLQRPDVGEAYEDCWSEGLPVHRDTAGTPVVAQSARDFSCALTGMMPFTDYWFAVVPVNAEGASLVPRALTPARGQTQAMDLRTAPPDTRPVLFALGSIILSLVILLMYLRWRDLQEGRVNARLAHLYIAPAMIALAALTFYPVLYGIWLSFTDASQTHLGEQSWIGLDNFGTILTSPGVGRVGLFTLAWAVANVGAHLCLGLLLAISLNHPGLKGRTIYRTLLLLPWAIPGYISVLAWRGMLEPAGLLNSVLGTEFDWLASPNSARTLVILVNIWLGVPFMMMALSGALQSLPSETYEAAEVDGVRPWRQFLHLTLPSLKSIVVPLSLLGFIWTFNMFHVIFLLTRGNPPLAFGEPGATDILITYVYDVAFEYGNYGIAAAWSVAIFLMLFGFSWFYLKKTRAIEAIR